MKMIETERLILRAYRKEDLKDLHEYLSDESVVKYEPYLPMNLEEVEQVLAKRISSPYFIAVELKENHKLIGNLYFADKENSEKELGYVFNKYFWRNGYAKEACKALLKQAWSQKVRKIVAECDPENEASWHLLESLGFTREAHLLRNVYFFRDEQGNPIWKDTYIYSLNNEG